jgi:hypothetical protein
MAFGRMDQERIPNEDKTRDPQPKPVAVNEIGKIDAV